MDDAKKEGKETQFEWVKFGDTNCLYLLGKDIIMLGYGNFITFLDLRKGGKESHYVANNDVAGDGAGCMCGHRSLMCFALAEKCKNPRILVNSYPSFETIKTIESVADTAFVAIQFSEMEYLVALTGLPSFNVIVWNWWTTEKLFTQNTGLSGPHHVLKVSITTPVVVAHTTGLDKALYLWELNVCHKKTLLDRNDIMLPADSAAPYSYTWGTDGELYVTDSVGALYLVNQESRRCQLEIAGKEGDARCTPCSVWYKGGLVFSTPGELFFYRKRSPEGWNKVFVLPSPVPYKTLISSRETLVGWTHKQEVMQIKGEKAVEAVPIKNFGCNFDFLCFVLPMGDFLMTYSKNAGLISVWNKITADLVATLSWVKPAEILSMMECPRMPYVVASRSDGRLNAINLYEATYPMELCETYLTTLPLDVIRFTRTGSVFCTANREAGHFFMVRMTHDSQLEPYAQHRADLKIVDFALIETEKGLNLLLLPLSQLCCRAGQTLLVYKLQEETKGFNLLQEFKLPSACLQVLPDFTQEHLICVPHRSRQIIVVDKKGKLVKHLSSGHQFKYFKICSNSKYLLSFGWDGIVIIRQSEKFEYVTVFNTHHRSAEGVRRLVIGPHSSYVITLGEDGTLVCISFHAKAIDKAVIRELDALMKSELYRRIFLNPIFAHKARAKAMERQLALKAAAEAGEEEGKEEVEGEDEEEEERKRLEEEEKKKKKGKEKEKDTGMTWTEMEVERKVGLEEQASKKQKRELLERFTKLQDQLKGYLDTNYTNMPEERLAVSEFDLDKPTRRRRIEEAKAEREKVKQMDQATIKARDKITEFVKERCWDVMEVKERSIYSIVAPLAVESYSLLPETKEERQELEWAIERRKVETHYIQGDFFSPWVPMTESQLNLVLETKFKTSMVDVRQEVLEALDLDEEIEGEVETEGEKPESPMVWTGSAAYRFIDINTQHYSQFETSTYYHTHLENYFIQEDIRKMMIWFNKQFEDMFKQKEREMQCVMERNERFRHIIRELSFFSFSPEICKTVIVDPEWMPTENPQEIVIVQPHEIMVPPYISPSEQELTDKRAAEAERLRLLLLADDFREKALMVMMDGVLEKLWEDEIKKEVPRPKFMEKDAELWTEDEIRAGFAYDDACKFLLSERERYRKILEAEWHKNIQIQKENVTKFDDKVARLHDLKLKVEASINQELLKVVRMRYKNFQRIMMDRKEDEIKAQMDKNEKKTEVLQLEVNRLQDSLNDCRNYYEVLQNKDRNLDKNFKKDFAEYSPMIVEQLYRLSKKRPKIYQKSTFSTVLIEMGRCAVNNTKPDHLPVDCLEFLKGIDALDAVVNAPAVVSEQSWELTCKLRRVKIDAELKIRACANDVAEAETTVAAYQKNLKGAKEFQIQLQNELQAVRDQKLYESQDFTVQVVLPQGMVEVASTGHMEDFEPVIIVGRAALDYINGIIKKVGEQKLRAMEKAANFRKGIIFKEWEHKRLRMEIEDLEDELATIERIKVTKELQAILTARARGFSDEKGFQYLEREIAAAKERFERTQLELLCAIDEMNAKIEKLNEANEELDQQIMEVNVDVNEKNMLRDKVFEKSERDGMKKRMQIVVRRANMARRIQDQHTEILMLQTELELLRLRTFPTIKFKEL